MNFYEHELDAKKPIEATGECKRNIRQYIADSCEMSNKILLDLETIYINLAGNSKATENANDEDKIPSMVGLADKLHSNVFDIQGMVEMIAMCLGVDL